MILAIIKHPIKTLSALKWRYQRRQKATAILNAAMSFVELALFYSFCALGWGFSIEFFKISVNTSNVIFGLIAIIGTLGFAVWHQEKARSRFIKRIIQATGDENIERKINASMK